MYKRVLLKLSGEALASKDFPFNVDTLNDIARQVKEIHDLGVKVGIVVGGGNICRGRIFEESGFDRVESDYIGMLATVINAKFVSESIEKTGIKAMAMSAVEAVNIEPYEVNKANELLNDDYVLVFGGGVGKPYHSTDTGSAQRALDINAEVILMAKSGVDGVYDKDPNVYSDAIRFDELTFNDILKKNLKVIDSQAAELCEKGKIQAFIFNMSEKDSIIRAVKQEITGTVVKF
ncbi:MAG: UMP kinase [Firmicutes bacterium]|nr:UMP kinase [Candidatus Colivicinus equi]